MILVDTGFLLAFAQPTDALHHRAKAWAATLNERFVVTEYVLWEVVNNLSMPLFQAGLEIHSQRLDKEWSLTDCISFYVMRERGITKSLAYDHHFEQAGFAALLRADPPIQR